ncbi:hypothetical protein [Diaphorobacter aerolatus]|uniref:DUF998 domain-containing protein n=1 Tax=Diaphorobacter aerolatus TaxID=1288495 RepID=A0A7H0GH78_9BURK|nr:hypothetical protein [Diaphorobacter aerolatus]QNP47644.1 hypothetical protein H9K75_15670 [Diaphorobacter aerolatus]
MLHATRTPPASRAPWYFVIGGIALWLLLTLFGPMLAQSPSYHAFADQRAWGGLPHAMDVLSNLGFLAGGLAGLWALYRTRDVPVAPTARAMAAVFFVGLIGCFAGSAYYHLAPTTRRWSGTASPCACRSRAFWGWRSSRPATTGPRGWPPRQCWSAGWSPR